MNLYTETLARGYGSDEKHFRRGLVCLLYILCVKIDKNSAAFMFCVFLDFVDIEWIVTLSRYTHTHTHTQSYSQTQTQSKTQTQTQTQTQLEAKTETETHYCTHALTLSRTSHWPIQMQFWV